METRRLEELLEGIEIVYLNDVRLLRTCVVSSISTDTRSLKKGDFFIALKGDKYDANMFIDSALGLGVSGIIFNNRNLKTIRKAVDRHPDIAFIGVDNTLNAYSDMAKNYLKKFDRLKKIAITGSSGKTTIRGLISTILSNKYSVIASSKSYNNIVGVSRTAFLIDSKHEIYIQELGTNHPGEINMLANIVNPVFGLITNIGPAHIGYFKSIENVAKEKKELLKSLPEEGIAFLNHDDPYAEFLKKGIIADVVYYGINKENDIEIKKIDLKGSVFKYKGIEMRLSLPGRHNILNAIGAITVGLEFGVSLNKIKDSIESFKAEKGRGFINDINGIIIIDESYNANPLSVKASIAYLSKVSCSNKKHLVLGDMAEMGSFSEQYHRNIGNYLIDSGIDYIYTIGKGSYSIYEECKKRIKSEVFHFYEINPLKEALKSRLKKGDIVLVKGSRIMRLDKLIDNLQIELNKN